MSYETLCGIWHRRKMIQLKSISMWVQYIATALGKRQMSELVKM